ncbi:hypothetical protein, partial [Ligilactobacillus salivarius]|uniref:hypothetical protein n=1 Tax=Ligilactobacillus salivarius TaxID=1624 RepID=UPI001CDA715B
MIDLPSLDGKTPIIVPLTASQQMKLHILFITLTSSIQICLGKLSYLDKLYGSILFTRTFNTYETLVVACLAIPVIERSVASRDKIKFLDL